MYNGPSDGRTSPLEKKNRKGVWAVVRRKGMSVERRLLEMPITYADCPVWTLFVIVGYTNCGWRTFHVGVYEFRWDSMHRPDAKLLTMRGRSVRMKENIQCWPRPMTRWLSLLCSFLILLKLSLYLGCLVFIARHTTCYHSSGIHLSIMLSILFCIWRLSTSCVAIHIMT